MKRTAAWRALLAACLLGLMPPVHALDEHGQLENPQLQARFERLTKELRCLVCQNESVADSNAFLARDLRTQVQEMLVAGKTDDQIAQLLGVAPSTVRHHLDNAREKLDAASRAEAVALLALAGGL